MWSTRCRKNERSQEPEQTGALASRRQRRLASLFARRSIKSDMASTVRGQPGRQLPLAFPKRGARASNSRRRSRGASRSAPAGVPNTPTKPARENAKSADAPGFRAPYRARSNAKNGAPSRARHCPSKHIPLRRGARPPNARRRREKPRTPRDGPVVLPLPKRRREKEPVGNHPRS